MEEFRVEILELSETQLGPARDPLPGLADIVYAMIAAGTQVLSTSVHAARNRCMEPAPADSVYLMWHCPERVAPRYVMNVLFASSLGVDVQPRAPAPPPGDLVSTGARCCMQMQWMYPHKSWWPLSSRSRRHDCEGERLESLPARTIYTWRHQARVLLPCTKPGRLSTTMNDGTMPGAAASDCLRCWSRWRTTP